MKSLLLVVASGLWSAINPQGCGAAVGSDVANGPGTGRSDAGNTGTPLPQTNCGALGSHFYCDDFSGSALPAHFDNEESSSGILSLDSSMYVSPPQSLLAATQSITTGTRTYADLKKSFNVTGSRFVLEFSEWVDPTCIGPYDSVQSGTIVLGQNGYFLSVRHGAGGDSVAESSFNGGAYLQSHVLRSSLPRGTWARITLDANLATGTMDLAVNGSPIMQDEPLNYSPGATAQPGITVGVLTDNLTFNPSACKTRIDDVTFDVIAP